MIVKQQRAFVMARIMFFWQWKYSLYYLLISTAATAAHELVPREQADHPLLDLPTLPLVVVGAALSIFVSFRTNSAYDRWWEGRKLWGRMINESRHWASQVVSYVDDPATRTRLVHRHAAYVHALRCMLRGQKPLEDEQVLERLKGTDEVSGLDSESNLTHALLARQLDDIVQLNKRGELGDLKLQSMDQTLRELINIQGGCERIQKTPMPPLYGLLANRLVLFYALLFPLAVAEELSWWTVPINLLVCTAFSLIAEAGRVLETPFTLFFNGLPLSAISRMIEVNTRQRLGERELPALLHADSRGVLM